MSTALTSTIFSSAAAAAMGVDGINCLEKFKHLDDEERTLVNCTAISDVTVTDVEYWDPLLWTTEQRQLLERGAIPRQLHLTLGILLSVVVIFGIVANATILYVFSR